jgi:ABC-type glutathione transport system ATPase component
MSMRLAFSISSHVHPDVLLLDEVLAVGDEAFQRKCFGRIFDFRRSGGTLVFVSHDPAAVERICDRAILLVDAEVAADGDPADVLAAYHQLLSAGRDGDASTPDQNAREWGTREAVIQDCRIVGPEGPTDRLLSGQEMTIEMDVVTRRPIATPNFGIAVHTADGVLVYATNTRMDSLAIDHVEGAATVRFTVDRLNLHEGRFVVSLAIASQDESTIYHWLDRRLEFSVFQSGTGTGPVDMTGRWRLSGETQVPAPSQPQSMGST